jgi:transcriptional regulator with XRE-family HTH domain
MKKDLAVLLDVSPAYVSLLESGARKPSRRLVKVIAEVFSCAVGDLFEASTSAAPSDEVEGAHLKLVGTSRAAHTGSRSVADVARSNPSEKLTVGDLDVTVWSLLSGGKCGVEVKVRRSGAPPPKVLVSVHARVSGRFVGGSTDASGRFVVQPTDDFADEPILEVRVSSGELSASCTLKLPRRTSSTAPTPAATEGDRSTRTSVGPLSPENRALRKAVVELNGELKLVAAHLGLSRPAVSAQLNGPVHRAWWTEFKAKRAKQRGRQRKRGARVRQWLRDKRRYPSDVPFTQRDILERVKQVGRRRGLDDRQSLDAAFAALVESRPDFHGLFDGDWNNWTNEEIAVSLLTLADALGLARGPGPLLWSGKAVDRAR